MERVVITGPTGAIGIAMIRECIRQGREVVAICHKNSGRISYIPTSPLVTIVECDLQNLKELQADTVGPCDFFFHLAWAGTTGAARNDMQLQTKNIQYTLDAVELAVRLGCSVFVGAGSQAEYGLTNTKLTPDTPVKPETGYGMAKLCAGQMSRHLCKERNIRHIWMRILSIYGPYDGPNSMLSITINKLLKDERPVFTKGEQIWDYLYSEDAAKAMLLAAEKGKDGAVYCLGSGMGRQLREYIEIVRNLTNKDIKLQFGEVPYAKRQLMYLCADISSLTKDTGFLPCTEFEDGIEKTISWHRTNIV